MAFNPASKSNIAAFAAIGFVIAGTAAAQASGSPHGIWFDHDGRGAVEIADCEDGNGVCGYVVHVKNKKHADRCGLQILGNVTPSGGGWIYSPSRGSKYTVRINRLDDSKLRVVGNASSSFFSKTFTWKKAPGDIEFCGKYAHRNAKPETRSAAVEDDRGSDRDAVRAEAAPGISDYVVKPRPVPRDSVEREEEGVARADRDPVDERGSSKKSSGGDWDNQPDPPAGEGKKDVGEVVDRLIDEANHYTKRYAKRTCEFRIPYVDRVIQVPCEN